MKYEEIPQYYFESGLIDKMINNNEMSNITKEYFIEKYGDTIMDDSEIIDFDHFLNVLKCLSIWLVDKLPIIIFNYVDKNIRKNYSEIENLCLDEFLYYSYYNQIKDHIKFRTKFKQIIAKTDYYCAIKEDDSIEFWHCDILRNKHFKNNDIYSYINIKYLTYCPIIIRDGDLFQYKGFDEIPIICNYKFITISGHYNDYVAINNNKNLIIFDRNFKIIKEINDKFLDISCGSRHTSGIKENGTVITFSNNDFEIDDQIQGIPTDTILSEKLKFDKIYCGSNYSIAIKKDKTFVSWGNIIYNSNNQKYISIDIGPDYFTIITEDGILITIGNQYSVRKIDIINKIKKISHSENHSAAIYDDNTIVEWDNNGIDLINTPNEKFIDISCGGGYTVGIKEDGTILSWINQYEDEDQYGDDEDQYDE